MDENRVARYQRSQLVNRPTEQLLPGPRRALYLQLEAVGTKLLVDRHVMMSVGAKSCFSQLNPSELEDPSRHLNFEDEDFIQPALVSMVA